MRARPLALAFLLGLGLLAGCCPAPAAPTPAAEVRPTATATRPQPTAMGTRAASPTQTPQPATSTRTATPMPPTTTATRPKSTATGARAASPTQVPKLATPTRTATSIPPTATPLPPTPFPTPPTPTASPTLPPAPSTPAPPGGPFTPPVRMVVPAIGLDIPVVEVGWRVEVRDGRPVSVWEMVSHAAGHHRGSANPGERGNVVLSGHHNIAGEVFREVSAIGEPGACLRLGDEVILYAADGRAFTYRIVAWHRFRETGTSEAERLAHARFLEPADRPILTLVTCWPYVTNSHRVVVVAELVGAP
ncbi:MAG: sortase [Anaerolineae bacterium]|nr:sortase [Anaerolineae bacterium]